MSPLLAIVVWCVVLSMSAAAPSQPLSTQFTDWNRLPECPPGHMRIVHQTSKVVNGGPPVKTFNVECKTISLRAATSGQIVEQVERLPDCPPGHMRIVHRTSKVVNGGPPVKTFKAECKKISLRAATSGQIVEQDESLPDCPPGHMRIVHRTSKAVNGGPLLKTYKTECKKISLRAAPTRSSSAQSARIRGQRDRPVGNWAGQAAQGRARGGMAGDIMDAFATQLRAAFRRRGVSKHPYMQMPVLRRKP